MKKFILKIFSFLVLYLLAVNAINWIFTAPYYWGNSYFALKEKYVSTVQTKKPINCFFIGSSRIYRQVVPSLFDSLSHRAFGNENIRSFNMGCPATFSPELYFLTENFIRNRNHIKYIFLELNENSLFDENIFTVKGSYWISLEEYTFALQLKKQSKEPNRIQNLIYLSEGYVQNLLTCRQLVHRSDNIPRALGPNKDGYYSLESDMTIESNTSLENLKIALEKDSTVLQKRAVSIARMLKNKSSLSAETVLYRRIHGLLKYCNSKKIKLVCLLTPRKLNSDVVECFNSLPAENKIDLCDPDKFPEFYQMKFSFDAGHLNHAGAELFTMHLYYKFAKLMSSETKK